MAMEQPAFQLDFEPTLMFQGTAPSGDEFDKLLCDLDLSLVPDTTTSLLHAQQDAARAPGAAAAGLRELFGLQQQWGAPQHAEAQQPPPAQPAAPTSAAEQRGDGVADMQAEEPQAEAGPPQQQSQPPSQPQPQQAGLAELQPDGALAQQQFMGALPLTGLGVAGIQGLPYYPTAFGVVQHPTLLPQQMLQVLPQHAGAGQQPAFIALAPFGAAGQLQASGALFSLPPWAFMQPQPHPGGVASSGTTSSGATAGRNGTQPAAGRGHANGRTAAGGGSRRGAGRGRGAGAAAAAPGVDKPKGPSQRFRERQKATISNLEEEVTRKLAELQALSRENEVLKLRSAVLEAVTSGREYHMRIIREHGPPRFDVTDSSPHSSSGGAGGCTLGGLDGAKSRSVGSDAAAAAAAAVAGDPSGADSESGLPAASGSPHSGSIGSCATGGAPSAGGAAPPAAGDPLACSTPDTCTPAMQQQTIRCIKQMSAGEIVAAWRQFLHDVSGELLANEAAGGGADADGEPAFGQHSCEDTDSGDSAAAALAMAKTCRWCGCTNSAEHLLGECSGGHMAAAAAAQQQVAAAAANACPATEQRLVALVNRYSYMTKFVALLNPGVLYSVLGRDLDTGTPVPYTDDHWRTVVSHLHLSKHQVSHILAFGELYFSSLSSLVEERAALLQGLKDADGSLSECTRRLLGIDGTVNQLALLDRLSSNLKREHVLRIMLNCFVWGRILTAVQFAKTAVFSSPFFPDVHAMVCVLCEDTRASPDGAALPQVFPHRQHTPACSKPAGAAAAAPPPLAPATAAVL